MLTRQQIYTFLIIVSAALMLGRIAAVNRIDTQLMQKNRLAEVPKKLDAKEQRLRAANVSEEDLQAELEKTKQKLLIDAILESPVFSANDRSRWNTLRVLVEPDMRVQRTRTAPDGFERTETVWYAIDKAQNVKGWDTIDMVKHELPDEPGTGYLYSSKPPLLPTVLAIPYALIYKASGGKLSLESEPFLVVRIMLVVCNLLPLMFCWFLLSRLVDRFGTTDWGCVFTMIFVCFGTFHSTFAVTLNNHLPAVVCVTIAFYCTVKIVFDQDTRWRCFFGAGFFSAFAVACELPSLLFCVLLGVWLFWHRFGRTLFGFFPAALVVAAAFFTTNYIAHKTLLPAYSQQSWYFYEYERGGVVRDSYWKNPSGIDKGEKSHADYLFHTTIGHHGLFSLTPVWAMSFIGLGIWLFDRRYRTMSAIILLTSLVVFAFYMSLPLQQRNYGGMTSALRWLFWLAPLWSVALASAADRFSRHAFYRLIALACLIVSVMSVTYPIWNPWAMPWTYNLMEYIML